MTDNITVTIETPTDREVVVTRVFDALRQLVFDALTRPELIKKWYRPPGAVGGGGGDGGAGGSWGWGRRMRGKLITQYGVYREVDAPQRFVRTERWEDWDPGETVCTTELTEQNGRTTMSASMVFPTKQVRDVVLAGGLTQKGTSEFYDRLDALLVNP